MFENFKKKLGFSLNNILFLFYFVKEKYWIFVRIENLLNWKIPKLVRHVLKLSNRGYTLVPLYVCDDGLLTQYMILVDEKKKKESHICLIIFVNYLCYVCMYVCMYVCVCVCVCVILLLHNPNLDCVHIPIYLGILSFFFGGLSWVFLCILHLVYFISSFSWKCKKKN